jgi:hypothetical protein
MANGLSIPSLSLDQGRFQSLFGNLLGGESSPAQNEQANSGEVSVLPSDLRDILDLGGTNQDLPARPAPGAFQVSPNGTYQFTRSSFAASFDFSMSQATVEASQAGDEAGVFASLTNLQVSVRVSAEFEQALLETGRNRGPVAPSDFSARAGQVVERFKAQQIRASLEFDLSFSMASVSFDSGGGLSSNLGDLSADGTLGGFVTLLETLFGDDERFKEFIEKLKGFIQGVQGGGEVAAEAAPINTEGVGTGGPQSFSAQVTSVRASVNLSFESTSIEMTRGQAAPAQDPIVLDLDGDGVELTDAEHGVRFDLDANGSAEITATAVGGDGLLALDRNGNGTIDNGKELFGDQHGARNGFGELAKFDGNRDGLIDAKDRVFDQLRVVIGRAGGALSPGSQLLSLSQVNIQSINLRARDVFERASGGNHLAQRSYFTRNDGSQGQVVDALLNRLV